VRELLRRESSGTETAVLGGSGKSSSESDESERTLFTCKSRSVKLWSVLLDALDVLVFRLEMLAAQSVVGGDMTLGGLRLDVKGVSVRPEVPTDEPLLETVCNEKDVGSAVVMLGDGMISGFACCLAGTLLSTGSSVSAASRSVRFS
jgi:hypothetical protein